MVSLLLLGQLPGAAAQSPTSSDPAIPSTPAGIQLEWALDQVNTLAAGLTAERVVEQFDPLFLTGITPEQLIDVFRFYVGPAGPLQVARFEGGVTDQRANALLAGPAGYWRVALSVDTGPAHRINGLYFQPVWLPGSTVDPSANWSDLKRRFDALAPRTGFFAAEITDGSCDPLARVHPDEELAIASSFKLYVLGELAHQVSLGAASWDELLAADPELVSLPNGDMRYAAAGDRFPLVKWAEQMIAQSDNTATDHLIARLGRTAVETAFGRMGHAHPELNQPLLMTREWFAIKMRLSDDDLTRYLSATVEDRRSLLETMVQPQAATLAEWELWPAFRAIDTIEWFASAADLCNAVLDLWKLSAEPEMAPVLNTLSLQPNITFDPGVWSYVGYKGGYEAGVKSDVWLLERADGRWFVLAGIINNPLTEIDGYGMADVMVAAAGLLAATE
ncbi:MAG: serine hydrolase [Thermomicrobiales bacterium]|nr:serine hydrolase [Thermomicrobiales bacterium]